MSPCCEIVTYRVEAAGAADIAREQVRAVLSGFDGFIGWIAFTSEDDARARADLVAWRSREHARRAAEAVETDARFAAFRAGVIAVDRMDHYRAIPAPGPEARADAA
jgi:predicted ATP-grasp superfamily ATP-dependent carboligase